MPDTSLQEESKIKIFITDAERLLCRVTSSSERGVERANEPIEVEQ